MSEASMMGHVWTDAGHRLERCREVFTAVASRLTSAGMDAWLLDRDGRVLEGPAPAPVGMTVGKDMTTPGRQSGRVVIYAPLGRVKTDAWLAVEVSDGGAAEAIRTMLPWMLSDAEEMLTLSTAAVQSGDRLAAAYEQMHVMFGLTRLLDGQTDAYQVVARVLEEMRGVLDFAWLAVRFGEHPRLRAEVSGRLIVSADVGASTVPGLGDTAESMLMSGLARMRMVTASASPWGGEYVALPVKYEGKTVAVLLAGGKGGDDPAVSSFDTRFLTACADLLGVFHENLSRHAEQRALFMGTVRALTSSIDAKHRYTRGHSERVSLLAGMMASALGLSEAQVRMFRLAGLLHDVGKIGIPEAILSKPTRLTDEEFEVIKRHPVIGHEILRGIPGLEDALPGVLYHHEQYGGRGYPEGLTGEAIPLIGRVLALCDTFDAMSSSRSYRAAMSREAVLAEINRCAGRQFDPTLAELFVQLDFGPFDAMFASHGDEHAHAAAA